MRQHLALAAAALALFASAHAATYENASRLVAAIGLEAEIDTAIGDAVSSVRAQLTRQGMAPAKIDEFIAAFRDDLENTAPALVADLTRVYADRFSDAEVDELVEFYQSPAGQKLVSVQHDLAVEQAQAVLGWIAAAAQSAAAKQNAAGSNASV
jgi:hypothetical protein